MLDANPERITVASHIENEADGPRWDEALQQKADMLSDDDLDAVVGGLEIAVRPHFL